MPIIQILEESNVAYLGDFQNGFSVNRSTHRHYFDAITRRIVDYRGIRFSDVLDRLALAGSVGTLETINALFSLDGVFEFIDGIILEFVDF